MRSAKNSVLQTGGRKKKDFTLQTYKIDFQNPKPKKK